jgi:DNA-binding response OmpR family regulator
MVKVLVIDDDRMNCDLLHAILTRHGYEVHTATSGLEGMNLFRLHAPRVTILDLRMPEMDGLTTLKQIRAVDPMAPVIILGGGATETQENQARALRATDFIRKGLSLDVLVESVNRIVQQQVKKPDAGGEIPSTGPVADLGETVLIVDDDDLVRDMLVQFFSLRGYRTLGAKDGKESLAIVEKNPPDIILLDLMLPGISGVEVLRRLRAKDFSGQIVIITGSSDEELLQEAWALNPQEVVYKPVDLEKLLAIVQLVLVCREC